MQTRKLAIYLVISATFLTLGGCFGSSASQGRSSHPGYGSSGDPGGAPTAEGGSSPAAQRWGPEAPSHHSQPSEAPADSPRGGAQSGVSRSTPPPAPGHGPAPAQPSPVLRHRGGEPSPQIHHQDREQRVVIPQPADRPGLGTVYGEQVASRVNFTSFVRTSSQPSGVVSVHYNDYQGLVAMARRLDRSCCGAIGAFSVGAGLTVQLVDGNGRPLSGLQIGGRTLVMGAHGQSYGILLRNNTGQRWEVVASVDGLDVIDGQQANTQKRGYVLGPWQTLHIQGFRTSQHTVAAFRFGSVRDSYAARTGSDRNVGVVGIAAFAEHRPPVIYHRQPYAQPPPPDGEADRRLNAQPFGPSHH